MTITPMAAVPTAAVDAAGPAASAGDEGAQTFGALIAAHLGRLEGQAPALPSSEPSTTDDQATPLEQPDPFADPALLLATAPELVASAVAAGPVPAPPSTPSVSGNGTAGAGAVEPATDGHTGPALPAGPVASETELPSPARLHDRPGQQPLDAEPPAGIDLTDAGRADADPGPPDGMAGLDAADTSATPADPGRPAVQQTAPQTSSPALVAAVPASATVDGGVAAAPVPTQPANPVLDQVAPVFTRLVSGPEGQHRMTLRLHPADLGEIHLTVTVNGNAVEVTVAARPEARELLVDGSSQLRGLLDSVGRTAQQITFRDLPGTGSSVQVIQTGAGSQPGTDPDGQPTWSGAPDQGGTGSGQGRASTRPHHGERVDHRDERGIGPAGVRNAPTSHPTSSAAPRGGLDVRM